jgi:putative ABC transport system substrate-binding protein
MRRRDLIVRMVLASAMPGVAAAQHPQGIRRVAILTLGANRARPVFTAFREELQRLGYVEGRTIAIAIHLAEGNAERLDPLAQTIVRGAPDVTVADGSAAAIALRAATHDIPIVAIGGIDPLLRPLATSLARPGGNLTGISTYSVELGIKQLELLHELAPAASRIGALGTVTTQQARHALSEAGTALGLTVRWIDSQTAADVERDLAPQALADVDALVVTQSPALSALSALVVAQINACGKPAIYGEREYIDAGGLATYAIDFVVEYRRLAGFVDRILRGATPSALPIERPERLAMAINLRTARALGITVPPSLLLRADEVIE